MFKKIIDEFQIIYKVEQKQDVPRLSSPPEGNSSLNFFPEKDAKVKPRGTSTGFFKRQKSHFSTLSPSLTNEKPKQHKNDYFPSEKLQFGFSPLPPDSKPSEIY